MLKLRVNSMVVLTAWCGAFLYTRHLFSRDLFVATLGVAAVAAGTAALNQILERDVDAKMIRTARRPLVTGAIRYSTAVMLALGLVFGGVAYLALCANLLTGLLALLTSLVYVVIYTPSKKLGPWCTTVGAVPGAMPIVLGWCAVGGPLDRRAALLFLILYLWQFPHFHAIALMYREDYRRAKIRMLAVTDTSGRIIAREILICATLLLCVSTLPFVLHEGNPLYLAIAVVAGAWFGFHALVVAAALRNRSDVHLLSRGLLRASVLYLPLLLIVLVLNGLG
ncbi:MAG TPA: heme o synthase [Candidatus Angelobacter sp.]|nr:heme o synthase [Candidatus Angelobacter sp.]